MTTSELSREDGVAGPEPAAAPTAARRRHARHEVGWLLATMAVTTILVALVLHLWRASPRIPFAYASDANFTAVMVKGTADHGWYEPNKDVGAPFGYDLHDFPVGGDNLGLVLVKGLTLLSHDWALVTNAYWLLTFPLVSGVGYLVMRRLGLNGFSSLVMANLFTLLPYHFIPGEIDMLLSGYWAVPLGGLLVLDALRHEDEQPLVGRRSPRWRWIWSLALCAVIASSGPYYAFFTVALLVLAGGLALLSRSTRANGLRAAVLVVAIVGVSAVNNLPSLLYHHRHGTNPQVASRALGESDLYGLHLAQLVLPVAGHRLAPLAHLSARVSGISAVTGLPGAPNDPLGMAAVAGLVLSVGWCFLLALRARGGATLRGPPLLARLGLLNLACILLATTTGLSTLVGLAGFLQVRVWARMAVFIGFFSLAAAGVGATLAVRYARTRLAALNAGRRGALITHGPLVVLACLAVLDQTTPSMVPNYAYVRAQVATDREFVQRIEDLLPAGSAVFQLPIVSFPERPPVVAMADYDQFRPYLQSQGLRWSYGSMRGRPADWSSSLGGAPIDTFLDSVAAAGFSGLYVNRDGFADRGLALETELVQRLGPPVDVSGDQRQSFYDIRQWAGRERLALTPGGMADRGQKVLHPVEVRPGAGTYPAEVTPPDAGYAGTLYSPRLPGQSSVRWARSTATFTMVNPLPDDRRVAITFGAAAAPGASGVLQVRSPGNPLSLPLQSETVAVRVELVLPPGSSTLTVVSSVPDTPLGDGRAASFSMSDLRVDDLP